MRAQTSFRCFLSAVPRSCLAENAHQHGGGEHQPTRCDIIYGEKTDQAEQKQRRARQKVAAPAFAGKAQPYPVFQAAPDLVPHDVIFGQPARLFQQGIYFFRSPKFDAEGNSERFRVFGERGREHRLFPAARAYHGGEFVRRGRFELEQKEVSLFFDRDAAVFYFCVLSALAGKRFGNSLFVVCGRVHRQVEGKFLHFELILPRGIAFAAVPFYKKMQKKSQRARRGERTEERAPKRAYIKAEYAKKEKKGDAEKE